MNNIDNEIPKYRKKRKSSVSKSKEKSKHKHEYVDCLLVEPDKRLHKATYCKVCGKIGNVNFFETEESNHGRYGIYRMLNKDEIFKKYKDLKQIHVDNIRQKYIPIKQESGDSE